MKSRTLFVCAVAAFAALPGLAAAQAVSANWVNLRAGPDRDYPEVTRLGPGTPLNVQGCTAGFGWCDVIAPNGLRGWVYAGNISYPYQSRTVPVLGYGAMIGIPIVTFTLDAYWGSYYNNQPWYRDRQRWEHHRPPPRPIVRPRPVRPLPTPPGSRPPAGDHRPPARPLVAKPPGASGRPPAAVPAPRPGKPAPERRDEGHPEGGDQHR